MYLLLQHKLKENINHNMNQQTEKKTLTLKTLTKNNVWDVQENDIFRMWEGADKDIDIKDNARHYIDMIKSAFIVEELKDESPAMKAKYEKLGYTISQIRLGENTKIELAIKKKAIMRVNDLTYENIHHITAAKLIEVLDRNFGGGWESLSQSIRDIIERGFDISTTTLPKDRLHKPGGMYERKVADGYEVLEVTKGTWVEAIFAKAKPEMEKPRMKFASSSASQEENEEDDIPEDTYNKPDEDDMEPEEPTEFSDDDITEENYRTTFSISGDPDEEAEGLADYIEE